jgi:Mor family transcriptional regulator
MAIAERIVMGLESQVDLAKEYRVSKATICLIMKKMRKKPEAVREAIHK